MSAGRRGLENSRNDDLSGQSNDLDSLVTPLEGKPQQGNTVVTLNPQSAAGRDLRSHPLRPRCARWPIDRWDLVEAAMRPTVRTAYLTRDKNGDRPGWLGS